MRSKVVRMLVLVLMLGGTGIALTQSPPASPAPPTQPQAQAPPAQPQSQAQSRPPGSRYPGGNPQAPPAQPQSQAQSPPAPLRQKQPKASAEKSKLEEMLAEALKNNPDIRVAAAKLAEAEAELNRTRIQVTQKIVALHAAIASKRAEVAYRERQYRRYQDLSQRAEIDDKLVDEAEEKLTLAKAQLEELEAQLPALLGKTSQAEKEAADTPMMRGMGGMIPPPGMPGMMGGMSGMMGGIGGMPPPRMPGMMKAPQTAEPMAEKMIREALSRSISLDFKDRPVKEIVDALRKDSGLVIQFVEDRTADVEETVSIRCENIPLSVALQLLEDSLSNYMIVVRDYGLLITHKQNVPPGAISVQEFLRQKPAEK